MDEPCRSLCENSRIDLYVINLTNPTKKVPPDTKIPVKLRANDKIDVLDWWFTQDGFPLRFREGRTQSGEPKGEPKRDGAKDQPLKLGKNDQDSRYGPGGTLEDKGEVYNISHTSHSAVAEKLKLASLDLRATLQQGQTAPSLNVPNPDHILEIVLKEQLKDELEDFAELLPLAGSLSDSPSYWAGFDLSFGIPLSQRWHLAIEASRTQGKVVGTIPFINFRTGSEAPIETNWEGQISQEELLVMLGYEFIKGLNVSVGGFKGRQRLMDSYLTVYGQPLSIPMDWKSNIYGMAVQIGTILPIAKGIDCVFNAKGKGYLNLPNPVYRHEINMGIRFKLFTLR